MAGPSKPNPMDVALGAAIRVRRRSLGMSQEALADRCGVSFQQVQKYENGSNRVSFSRLVQIAHALDCRVAELTGVLDEAGAGGRAALELTGLLRTPGAVELLTAFERLAPDARAPLVKMMAALTGVRADGGAVEEA